MNRDQPGYGLWMLALLNSAIFLMFAFSFVKPQTGRDLRTLGAFAAFVVALFVKIYGFPLTTYLMSGWLQTKYLDLMSHHNGHTRSTLLGENGDPHFGALHIPSYAFLGLGFYLLPASWSVLYHARRANRLAATGPCARIRHPQLDFSGRVFKNVPALTRLTAAAHRFRSETALLIDADPTA